jgi:hypothetical protein
MCGIRSRNEGGTKDERMLGKKEDGRWMIPKVPGQADGSEDAAVS